MKLDGGLKNSSITGNLLYWNGVETWHHGIEILTTSDLLVSNNKILGSAGYGIRETMDATNNAIIDNDVRKNTQGGMYSEGIGHIVRNNVGYVTENSGTATIPEGSTSVIVNHGLADTPSIVTITPNKDTRFWVTDKTSSQFTINIPSSITGGVSFDWYAEV